MRNLYLALGLTLILTLGVSCWEDDDSTPSSEFDDSFLKLETPGTYETASSFVANPNAYELDVAEGILEDEEEDTVALAFPARNYQVGDVIVGADNNPFLKIIKSISSGPNGEMIFNVEQGALTDLIQDGEFSFNVAPDWRDGDNAASTGLFKTFAINNVQYNVLNLQNYNLLDIWLKGDGTINISSSLVMNKPVTKQLYSIKSSNFTQVPNGRIQLTVKQGQIQVIPTVNGYYNFGNFSLQNAQCNVNCAVVVNLDIEAKVTGSVGLKVQKDLISPIKIPIKISSKPKIQFDLILKIPAGVNLNANVAGTARFTYNSRYALQVNMSYTKATGFVWNKQFSKQVNNQNVSWNAQGFITADFWCEPTVQLKLFKILGPYVYLHPHVRADLHYPWQAGRDELFLDIQGGAGLELTDPIFNRTLKNWKTGSLFHLQWSWDIVGPKTSTTANRAPLAQNMSVSVPPNGAMITLKGSDADGDMVNWDIVSNPSKGVLGVLNRSTGRVFYQPQTGASGTDTFTVQPTDGTQKGNVATITVNITTGAAPKALFTYTKSGYTLSADASNSADREDPTSGLLVRWDWDNDGNYDTTWTYTKTASHTYPATGTFIVGLEVKDSNGNTDKVTQAVNIP